MGAKDKGPATGSDMLHQGRLGGFARGAADYTSSIEIDGRLLLPVILIDSAHTMMLQKQGIIKKETASEILSALNSIPRDFKLDAMLEDVHMNVEAFVIQKAGSQAGGMLNLAKSRNDQVSAALRIALREALLDLGGGLNRLEDSLLLKAKENAGVAMPGYTHLQRAQVVTVGHHLLSYVDLLDRDSERILECYRRVNLSPLGAGALASTSFKIDREFTARLLGFDGLIRNSIDAVSSRDFVTEAVYVCSQTMTDISRLAEELILWSSKEFSYIEMPDEYSSTSSMMPQKKNAVVPEIARARAAQVVGELAGALGLMRALPLSYNLDLQELTRDLWSAMDKTSATVSIFAEMIKGIRFNRSALGKALEEDDLLFATDVADYLVTEGSVPFREAHGRVASLARYCSGSGKRLGDLSDGELKKFLGAGISGKEVAALTDPKESLSKRSAAGSPNPKLVLSSCAGYARAIERNKRALVRISEAASARVENLLDKLSSY
jgi:argininosuccinate lyase